MAMTPEDVFSALEALAKEAPPKGRTIGAIVDALDERAFGLAIFLLAAPCCVPLLVGVPQLVALPILALSIQMTYGRAEPWLPPGLAARIIKKKHLVRTAALSRKWFGWMADLSRPRIRSLFSPAGQRIAGVFASIYCSALLIPFPATDTVPGIALAVSAIGVMTHDGFILIAGWLIGAAWFTVLISLFIAGARVFS